MRSQKQLGTRANLNLLCMFLFGLIVVFSCKGGIAQSPDSAEWPTSSGDVARDGWQQGPTKFTAESVKNIQLLWKVKVPIKTMGEQSFREPVLVSGVQTPDGPKNETVILGASNEVAAIDSDTGKIIWQRKLDWLSEAPQQEGEGRGFLCTNALTANPVVSPKGSGPRLLYLIANDGYFHTLALSTGADTDPPIQVLPHPYGKPYGLNLVNGVIYTITGQGCGGDPNALYAIDLATKKVAVSDPPQGGLWGVAGPNVGSDGTIYFTSGDGVYDAAAGRLSTSVLAFTFQNDSLTRKDYFTPSNHVWLTQRDLDWDATSALFSYKGRDILVGSGKEGRFYLLDSKSLGGANHMTPLYVTPLVSNTERNFQSEGTWGSHATWLAKDGTRWVLAPTGGETAVHFPIMHGAAPNGGIIAMKLTDKSGSLALEPVWRSRDMIAAKPPVIANGLVFALASGEFTGQTDDINGGLFGSPQRIEKSVPAVLYVLDGATGKELYSSGDQIKSFLHQAGIAVAGDKIVFGTFDGTIYCFGLK